MSNKKDIRAMSKIEEMINTPRDIQHIKQQKCRCGCVPYILETLARDRYMVKCFCGKGSKWHRKIDDAVMSWNNELSETAKERE